MDYKISPDYFHAAGTTLLRGRDLTWHDDKNSPAVALVNEEFARKMFGSVDNAIGRFFKPEIGTRLQVVGVVENGKYSQMTENPKPAIFTSFLQSPGNDTSLVVRSKSRSPATGRCHPHGHARTRRGLPLNSIPGPGPCSGPSLHPAWRLWRWGSSASWALCSPLPESLASPPILSAGACANSAFAWLSARSAQKCCRRHWAAPSSCSPLAQRQD